MRQAWKKVSFGSDILEEVEDAHMADHSNSQSQENKDTSYIKEKIMRLLEILEKIP